MITAGLRSSLRSWLSAIALVALCMTPAGAFEPLGAPFVGAGRVPASPTATLPSAPPGRSPVALPPAYPLPLRSSVPLPSSGAPLVFPGYVSPHGDQVWVSGRTETTISLDAAGRVTYGLEYLPGHFDRRAEPRSDR